MSYRFDENMECAISCLKSHFAASVMLHINQDPYIRINPANVDVISVNGYEDPWNYHCRVALDCDYVYFNLLDAMSAGPKKDFYAMIRQVYRELPSTYDKFWFKSFPAGKGTFHAYNTRCMFNDVVWTGNCKEQENADDDNFQAGEDDGRNFRDDPDETPLINLPADVEDKIFSAVWPYAQAVFSNLAVLHRNLRLLAMYHTPAVSGGIFVRENLATRLKLPAFCDLTRGPCEAPPEHIAFPFARIN